MRTAKTFLVILASLGMTACSSIVREANIIPTRIDVAGHVKEIAYTTNGVGMERPWCATLNSPEYGDQEYQICGYGSSDYKRIQEAKKHNGLVAAECLTEARNPCQARSIDTLIDPPKIIIRPQEESAWPNTNTQYEQSTKGEGFTLVQRNGQVNAHQCSKSEIKQWKEDLQLLTQEEKNWMQLYAKSNKASDFTLDGVPDTLEVIGTQSLRDCNLRKNIPNKEIIVTLTDGATGKKHLWSWTGGIPDHYQADSKNKKILVFGKNYDETRFSKTLSY